MSFFLVAFLSVYTAMHLVVWHGIRPLLPPHPLTLPLAAAWGGVMIAAPFLSHLLERADQDQAARLCAWVGYLWLGLLFLAFCAFALLACWNGGIALLGRISSTPLSPLGGPRVSAGVLLLVGILALYAYREAATLRVETVELVSPRLPSALDGVRIVQVSDLHLGLIHRHATVAKVVRLIRELRPDLLVATGDLVDAQISHLNGLSELFRDLTPSLGKFAVTGNHEYYAGLAPSLEFLRNCGFTLLRDRAATVAPGLTVVGVDDPAGKRSAAAALIAVPENDFVLLLKHRPRIEPTVSGQVDLQLSGHAHRGQIAPFNLLTALEYPLQNGLYRLKAGNWLYTSRGTGTWGPPLRLFSPPEVTLFVLRSGAPP